MALPKFALRGVAALAVGTFLATTPFAVGFQPSHGLSVSLAKAFAKDGGDNGGGGDHGGGDSGDHGGSGGGSDNSGGHGGSSGSSSGSSGSSDNGGDHGGSGGSSGGSGSDGSGNHGGNTGGSGSDDSSNHGGSDGSSGSHDSGSHGGSGGGSDDGAAAAVGGGAAKAGAAGSQGLQVVKIERTATGVDVVYSNGIQEEIANGHYELKNPAGRTVIERPATQKDLDRISANARASRITPAAIPGGSHPQKVEVSGKAIEVVYDTGWKEEVAAGRYELKDPNGNTVVERQATTADRNRLRALAGN